MSESWYSKSLSFIKQQQIEHPELPHAEMRKHCSKNYPFRERSGFAYKSFLRAMCDVFGSTRRKVVAGQPDIFDRPPVS